MKFLRERIRTAAHRRMNFIVVFCVLILFSICYSWYLYLHDNNVRQFFLTQADSFFNFGRTEAYGRVESISNGTLVLAVQRAGTTRVYHVRYNTSTRFYMFAPDAILSEVALSPSNIREGMYVSVNTATPISVRGIQDAVSIIVM